MREQAMTPHDANAFAALRSSAMARKTFGPRVVAALVPRFYKDLTALHVATGFAYSTVHDWSTGKADPRLEVVEQLAVKVGLDPMELLSGRVNSTQAKLEDHVDWAEALRRALERWANKIPSYAFRMAGQTAPARMPERLDEFFVFDLANFWFKHARDDELARAESAEVQREMDEEDAEIDAREAAKRASKPRTKK